MLTLPPSFTGRGHFFANFMYILLIIACVVAAIVWRWRYGSGWFVSAFMGTVMLAAASLTWKVAPVYLEHRRIIAAATELDFTSSKPVRHQFVDLLEQQGAHYVPENALKRVGREAHLVYTVPVPLSHGIRFELNFDQPIFGPDADG